ncbi:MAG: hypothetical protein H6Q83_1807, partial [Deltaproteobacteria bacterium]|nr:hypothetical protein [Deltaproteobacteria bacterium]
ILPPWKEMREEGAAEAVETAGS